MGIIEPGIGLLFWMTLTFVILLFLLAKFAWKPIVNAVNDRETSIVDALNQATLARKEMETLKEDNERIIREAKIERDAILKEAREIKDRIVGEAKDAAKAEGDRMIEAAKQTIQTEKNAAMADIKTQIGTISVNIAESILKQKLDNSEAQNELVQNYLNKSNLN
ncbi:MULTISPECIES: F0F1 ATP synthase subunit B [Chryseobacterium]|uniref:ATP synthase subunit b n=1 Tax=Chryseobacterium camelliae TaxID=1265445 RepID=A0ABU0THP8_9FLAO|nr:MULTISPECIES: F0F1 ATP synthase subunit B [Chryseobacterium]MDT3405833.1 F-type H+-transporting ATPase subunit b [Pseudacidovorax intermedius]MDQ1096361.1 F-type H+-transporting ATPase subunit b [Chryseobacterium camelliae]MDQ1100300.1 F-type H+-transporting ATPase subunit b [Chryseobacterium sp. SORGH_AS_1048]MDR6087643.1 F-type H+-transporting ATPase subunit b [Chryseobacterium sp. SORGH_AS_0909]MDR6132016.1 F-type H+-transporting ATPase subunit b [Chryseobacterium sp. SORGH_AS_1175]